MQRLIPLTIRRRDICASLHQQIQHNDAPRRVPIPQQVQRRDTVHVTGRRMRPRGKELRNDVWKRPVAYGAVQSDPYKSVTVAISQIHLYHILQIPGL